jgi:ribosomal protein L34E
MVAPGKRNLKKKFVKVIKKTKEIRFRDSSKGSVCGICHKKLQGVPKGDLRKMSKTEKRPSILFGGVLCNTCRDSIFDDAIMLKLNIIKDSDVSFKKKVYVNQALKHIDL